jgi:acyl-coenzyme A thioesterase PaaI-like protein
LKEETLATKKEIVEFMISEFPQNKCIVEQVGDRSSVIRHKIGTDELRPGGTVSGPVLMTVADVAIYVALLGEIGIVPLAVTTNLSFNFLRKPSADKDIVGVCKMIKIGRLLAIGEVTLYSEGIQDAVAHAVGVYAIPPADECYGGR